jgi:hypothetical protein
MTDLIRRAKFVIPATALCSATACSLIPYRVGASCYRVDYAILVVRYGALLLFYGRSNLFPSLLSVTDACLSPRYSRCMCFLLSCLP